jgi:hypothetical protein
MFIMDTRHDTRVNCIKPERRKHTADDTCSSCDTWRIVCEVHYVQEEEAQRRRLSIHHVHNLRTVSPQRFRRASRCQNLKKEYQVCAANLEATTMRRRIMKTTGEVAAWGERWRNADDTGVKDDTSHEPLQIPTEVPKIRAPQMIPRESERWAET